MGVWGAAQAAGFAGGGFLGAAGVDVLRGVLHADGPAFLAVFVAEAALFLAASVLAARIERPDAVRTSGAQAATVPVQAAAV